MFVADREQFVARCAGCQHHMNAQQHEHIHRQAVEQHIDEWHRTDVIGKQIDISHCGECGEQPRCVMQYGRQHGYADTDFAVGGHEFGHHAGASTVAQQHPQARGYTDQEGEPYPFGRAEVAEAGVFSDEECRRRAERDNVVPVVEQHGVQARAFGKHAFGHRGVIQSGNALGDFVTAQHQHAAFCELTFLIGDRLGKFTTLARDVGGFVLRRLAETGQVGLQALQCLFSGADAVCR